MKKVQENIQENIQEKNLYGYLESINFKKYLKSLELKLKNKKILLYGAGSLFRTIVSYYDLSKINIIGISDMSFKEETKSFLGYKAYMVDEIFDLEFDYILVCTLYYKHIIDNFYKQNKKLKGKILSIYENNDLKTKIKKFLNINNKNNEYLLITKEGKIIKNPKIKGLKVDFFGVNSKVIIMGDQTKGKFNNVTIDCQNNSTIIIKGDPICRFYNVRFYVTNGSYIEFNSSRFSASNVAFELGGEGNNKLIVGKDCSFGSGRYFTIGKDTRISIGNNCMCADEIYLRADDGHSIIDLTTNKPTNFSSDIIIGNNVWLGFRSTILKGSKVNDGSVVGFGSIVNKKFEEKNILIAGVPAKKVKENISWDMSTPEKYITTIENV